MLWDRRGARRTLYHKSSLWWVECLGAAKAAYGFLHADVDVSPPSDSGGRELFPEGNRERITEEPGQAGNGAALLGAMGALR